MIETRNSSLFGKITVLLVICFFALPAQGKYGGGTGEPNDPYQIRDANQMNAIGADSNDWDKCFKLMADLDFGGAALTPVAPDTSTIQGFQGTVFTGVFDGNGHVLRNATIDMTGTAGRDYVGLFGFLDPGGEIRNLGVEEVDITGRYFVGGLVASSFGTINDCYATGNVTGVVKIGGLVGYNNGGTISDSYATGFVTGTQHVGGLCGYNKYGTISNCYATGPVSGGYYSSGLGGLCGINSGTISNCYAMGRVTADINYSDDIGGLCGENYYGTISNCYATGSVSGGSYLGGLCGFNFLGTISNCFWDVQTSGMEEPGWGDGRTTAQMQTKSTFTDAGWDSLEIWLINDGATYPVLRQEIRCDLNGDGGVDFADFAIFADHWLEGKVN